MYWVVILMIDQASHLRQKVGRKKQIQKTGKTISIVSGKGGVGKSNFALNFSLELLSHQKKVLLFDLDVGMGNIDVLLGMTTKYTIVDMLKEKMPVQKIIEKGPNQLSYISGGSGLNDFFLLDDDKKEYFYEQYRQLLHDFDYIIFDLGAGSTDHLLFFVLSSDECIVLTTPEPTSLTDAYSVIKHIVNQDKDLPLYVVMNRSFSHKEGRRTLNKFAEVVKQFLQVEIDKMGVLPDDKTVTKAVRRQIPYVLLNKRAAISVSMKRMTHRYLQVDQTKEEMRPSSFIDKLRQLLRER